MKKTPRPVDPKKPRNLSEVQFKYFAPGKGLYGYHELQAVAPHSSLGRPAWEGGTLDQRDPGKLVGTLQWHPRTGSINWVRVDRDFRGLGVATTLLEKANKLAADTGIKAPKHSIHRTEEGDAWAKSVGGKVPRRAHYEEF